jgi:hypothetical protein
MKKNIALAFMLAVSVFAKAQQIKIKEPLTKQPKLTTSPNLKIDSTGMTKIVSVRPDYITSPLCPWVKTRGDNDFGDNEVRITVNIHYVWNMRYGDSLLKANIFLQGEENGGDRSTVKGEWQKVVYRAPAGWKIKQVRTDTNSLATYFVFNANPAQKFTGTEICALRTYTPATFGYKPAMPTVKDMRISVHKRNGDDFDTNESSCNCGFRLERIEWKYVRITLEKI